MPQEKNRIVIEEKSLFMLQKHSYVGALKLAALS